MGIFQVALILAAFLCSLVAGFLFAFAVAVMAGIKNLESRAFRECFSISAMLIRLRLVLQCLKKPVPNGGRAG